MLLGAFFTAAWVSNTFGPGFLHKAGRSGISTASGACSTTLGRIRFKGWCRFESDTSLAHREVVGVLGVCGLLSRSSSDFWQRA